MKVLIDFGDAKMWDRSLALGMAVRTILQATTVVNLNILRVNQVAHRKGGGKVPLIPPLYRSGVRYREEPQNWELEHFDTIPAMIGRRWGDCDDLGPWLAAELIFTRQDPRACVMIKWKRRPDNGNRLYHVLVRRSNVPKSRVDNHRFFADQRGVYEDPSRVLGMGSNPRVLAAHAGL